MARKETSGGDLVTGCQEGREERAAPATGRVGDGLQDRSAENCGNYGFWRGWLGRVGVQAVHMGSGEAALLSMLIVMDGQGSSCLPNPCCFGFTHLFAFR